MRSKIWILAASVAAAMGCGTAAHATCPSPFTVKDSTGTTQNVTGINDANNNCVFPNAITDGGGAANRAAVKAGSTSPAPVDAALVVSVSPNSLGCAGASIASSMVFGYVLLAGLWYFVFRDKARKRGKGGPPD